MRDGVVVEKVHVLGVLQAQHAAIDLLISMVLQREAELVRGGLMESKDIFNPLRVEGVRHAVVLGNCTIEQIEKGFKVEA